MKTVLHPAGERGHADHGWLDARHSFSFATYLNRERMGVGTLRVLNDDTIQPGMGFGTHPHENMEIITIPLSGALAHRDSMGHVSVIKPGEVQVMSAGTGITHSEYNASDTDVLNLLQIWIYPRQQGLTPRYDQIDYQLKRGIFNTLVNPDHEGGVYIQQDAWISMGSFGSDETFTYKPKRSDSVLFLFVIEGSLITVPNKLERRDALELWDASVIEGRTVAESFLLLLEVPRK